MLSIPAAVALVFFLGSFQVSVLRATGNTAAPW